MGPVAHMCRIPLIVKINLSHMLALQLDLLQCLPRFALCPHLLLVLSFIADHLITTILPSCSVEPAIIDVCGLDRKEI